MVEPDPSRAFPPAEAGALLTVVTLLVVGAGTLVGWAFGALATGLIVGAVVGLPAGVLAVYRRYHGYFA
jgi:F0F1-type ATP synthase assembly protein I